LHEFTYDRAKPAFHQGIETFEINRLTNAFCNFILRHEYAANITQVEGSPRFALADHFSGLVLF
jgi:hypothetical protein